MNQALHNHNGTAEGEDVEGAGASAQGEHHEGEQHDFSDIMIHQVSFKNHLKRISNNMFHFIGNSYHRVRSWICFSHCFLSASMGFEFGPFS